MRALWRLPAEVPKGPLIGYKLARLWLAADGSKAAFGGVSIGAPRVYDAVADASCVFSSRHRPPKRRCGCGFYCLHDADAARAMACDGRYRGTALITVQALGRFIRYEQGLRYARQRVRAVHLGCCDCGHPAECLVVDPAEGQVGWRRLIPVCDHCAGWRAQIRFERLAELLDQVPVVASEAALPIDGGAGPPIVGVAEPGEAGLTTLVAEACLLQARLDDLQARLQRATECGAPPAGTQQRPPGTRSSDGPAGPRP